MKVRITSTRPPTATRQEGLQASKEASTSVFATNSLLACKQALLASPPFVCCFSLLACVIDRIRASQRLKHGLKGPRPNMF